jgi:hypothetical protein
VSLNGRIDRLERAMPPDVCPHQPLVIVNESEPGHPTGPVPPCPLCGRLPMIIRIVPGAPPEPWEPRP